MKLAIDGMKHLDMIKLADYIREWEEGDILAYGLESSLYPMINIARDHLSKYGCLDTAIEELMAFDRLIRAMLASDSSCGIIVCKSLLHMSASMEDLRPELESADFESGDYIYVRRVTHTFEEFCKTGRAIEGGRTYLEDGYSLVILRRSDTLGWSVVLGNRVHVSTSLTRIERQLYNFAVDNDLI